MFLPERMESSFSPTVPAAAHSPRNQFVARAIREAGIGTQLFDLLTRNEEALHARTGHLRFDIGLLAERLMDATRWSKSNSATTHLRVGYFAASTGGGAVLVAAAELNQETSATRRTAGPRRRCTPTRESADLIDRWRSR